MTTRSFWFAVQAVRARSADEWHGLARRVEALGYTTLFVADHYLGRGPALDASRQPLQSVAPIAAMASAAAVTQSLRVGCRVFCVDYHVPAVLAKEAATLDLLSGGRSVFGIGAGWSAHEYTAMGLSFGPASDRVSKLEEVVALFKAHCAGEELALDGHHVTATGYTGLPAPVQHPHPPIMIGGSRRRVLSLAGRAADIASVNNVDFAPTNADGLTPAEEASRRLGYVQHAAGDRFASLDIESSPFFTRITDDPDGAAREIAGYVDADPSTIADHPNVLIGSVDRVVEVLRARRETFGVNVVTVQQRDLDHFAPVVEELSGT